MEVSLNTPINEMRERKVSLNLKIAKRKKNDAIPIFFIRTVPFFLFGYFRKVCCDYPQQE